MNENPLRIGLISDTHGLLRPGVFDVFEGVDLILHAGDVGGPDILEQLRMIAPVRAVYGNTDVPGSVKLTDSLALELRGTTVHVSHGHELGSPTPEALLRAYTADVIVYGHTHKQLIHRDEGRIVVNPGAAGPQRFRLEPSVAILVLGPGTRDVQLVDL